MNIEDGPESRPSQALLLRFAAAFPFPAVSVIGHPLDRGLVRGLKNWLVAERAGALSAGLIVHVQDLTGERRAHTPDSPESRRPDASTVREGCRHLRAYHEVRHGHLTERLRAERSGRRGARGDCPSGTSGGLSVAAPPFHDLLLKWNSDRRLLHACRRSRPAAPIRGYSA